jgi:hypothetical protein
MSSWARRPLFVGDHGSPDVVCEASFEAASCFAGALALGEFAVVVGVAAAAGCSDLGDGHGVQRGVELAVAAAGESVSGRVGAGDLDGSRTGVGGERSRAGEPAGLSGPSNQATCGDRADANGSGQGAARRSSGVTPAREANAASLRTRPRWDQLTRSWAATTGPTPGSASNAGPAPPWRQERPDRRRPGRASRPVTAS